MLKADENGSFRLFDPRKVANGFAFYPIIHRSNSLKHIKVLNNLLARRLIQE
jgi:hypothetical protein